jgi:Arc/MetJ-type ribon-helix-helix transcriptional regulator
MLVKYATVKIPQPLADKVVEIAVQKLGTYRTVSEFVIESTRQHLETIKP